MAVSFRSYLSRWFKAAFAPAWELFGWLGLAVGAILWAAHKYAPRQFQTFTSLLGITPEAAMSDLVWQLPLAAGGMVLAYRLLRAPYELHIAAESAHQQLNEHLVKLSERVTNEIVEEARPIRAFIKVVTWQVNRDERGRRRYTFVIEMVNREQSPIILEPKFVVQTRDGLCGPYLTEIKDFRAGLTSVPIDGRKSEYGTMIFTELFNPVPEEFKEKVVYPTSPTPEIADGHIALILQLTDVLSKKACTLTADQPYDVG